MPPNFQSERKVADVSHVRRIPMAACLAAGLTLALALPSARQAVPDIPRDGDDISGVVQDSAGAPEAGVWVIAETKDLPTPFARIVVTDELGRFVLPDLPQASYDVWVRGYGLVDSQKVSAEPGRTLALTSAKAPSAHAAAQYYPAGYWLSLLEVPPESDFPGTGPEGNGIPTNIRSQGEYLRMVKSGNCTACHQLGTKGTREIPKALGEFPSHEAAWLRRVASGQAGAGMIDGLNRLGPRGLRMFADWTERIAKGEYPREAPPRPTGIERNVVITLWDWADPTDYLHDVVSTDRRDPTVNANGPVYGALELSADYIPVMDPQTHEARRIPIAPRDPATPRTSPDMPAPSPYWGDEVIWDSQMNVHNPMIDHRGRVWLTAAVRPFDNPDYCKEGSSHPSAKLFPLNRSSRHLAMWDPSTKQLTHISTCFGTHHLMFALDDRHTLWTSGGGQVVGWLDVKRFEETGDEAASQGWTALVIDTNGNGRRDAYVEPNEPVDPTKDKRYGAAFYSVTPVPDGSVWGSVLGFPGAAVRLVPGDDPPHTTLVEVYEPPFGNPKAKVQGFSPRGMDVDRNGVVWAALASGHMASFDRRKCKGPLNGPEATGQHCPEGWTLYEEPLPQLRGVTASGSAEGSYYTWVDWYGALGLGENVPINTGNASEGLLVLKDGEWIVLRVPYPLGYYTKWMDGRIDDPNGGWKGRGIWTTISTRAPFHMEGGKGTTSKVIKFQMRPDPLAH
jgi:hypothetical protein